MSTSLRKQLLKTGYVERGKYRLIQAERSYGIYKLGGGFIVDPLTTMLFNDEIVTVFNNLTGEKNA